MELEGLTRTVIGCAMRVHSALGCGFPEYIYQRAMAIELEEAGVPFEREKELGIFFRGREIGKRRVDFYAQDILTVELKARTWLNKEDLNQIKNYLEASHHKIGLLLNFGNASLEFKRIYNNKLPPANPAEITPPNRLPS